MIRACRICQRRFMAPNLSAKSVLSLRLLSTSCPLICSTDWFTKSTVNCLQFTSTRKPYRQKNKSLAVIKIHYCISESHKNRITITAKCVGMRICCGACKYINTALIIIQDHYNILQRKCIKTVLKGDRSTSSTEYQANIKFNNKKWKLLIGNYLHLAMLKKAISHDSKQDSKKSHFT